MPRNEIDDILRLSKLPIGLVQPEEITDALNYASDYVSFLAPFDETSRSIRVEPLRKRAEAFFATAQLFRSLSPFQLVKLSQRETVSTPDMSLGIPAPGPIDYAEMYLKQAEAFDQKAETIIDRIAPITAGIDG